MQWRRDPEDPYKDFDPIERCGTQLVIAYNKQAGRWSDPAAPVLRHTYCCVETVKPTGGLTSIAPLDERRFWAGSTNGTIRFFDGSRVVVQVGASCGAAAVHLASMPRMRSACIPPEPRLLPDCPWRRSPPRPLPALPLECSVWAQTTTALWTSWLL